MLDHPKVGRLDALERLACLAHLCRAESWVAPWHEADVDTRKDIETKFDRLRGLFVDGQLQGTDKERRLAAKFIEMWTHADRLNVGWRMEGAAVLSWALQLRESLPSLDQQATDISLAAFVDPSSFDELRARAVWV